MPSDFRANDHGYLAMLTAPGVPVLKGKATIGNVIIGVHSGRLRERWTRRTVIDTKMSLQAGMTIPPENTKTSILRPVE